MTARLVLLLLVPALAAPAPIAFPDGFRGWNHVKSMTIGEGHPLAGPFGGTHHVYVNDLGLPVMRAGKGAFPDGAVLVFDLYEAKIADGATAEGPHRFTAVMKKDAKAFSTTGGWGFEVFQGADRARGVSDGGAACFTCHQAQAGTDFVFSRWRD